MKPLSETHPSLQCTPLIWSVDAHNKITLRHYDTKEILKNDVLCYDEYAIQKYTVDKQRLSDVLNNFGDYMEFMGPGCVDSKLTIKNIKRALDLEEQ